MKTLIQKHIVLPGLAAILLPTALAAAAGPVTVSVNTSAPGVEISPGMAGLSYETSLMLPDAKGVHYFRPDNKPLVDMFKTIGVKSLRIGGNSVDSPKIPIPGEEDVTNLFEFARAAGVKVIYSVRLEESTNSGTLPASTSASNAESAAKIARLIHDHYAGVLDCFAIGNEPDYFKDFAVYSPKWKAIHDAIVAEYPEAKFCGPDQNPSPGLDKQMALNFGNEAGRLVEITQHSYPLGCSYKNPGAPGVREDASKLIPQDAARSRDKMLSPAAYKTYEGIYKGIAGAITNTSITYRLSECNSYWFSGLKGASDSYASALWGADYLHWWADHGADGLNFHTGDRTGGELSMSCRYAAFVTSGHGYEARPLAYGMKLFDLGGYGKKIPATVAPATNQNLVAYATLFERKTVSVTLINKTHGPGAKEETVQIKPDKPLTDSKVLVIFLRGRNNDLGGSSPDVTLGGAPIKEDGTWGGQWTQLPPSAAGNDAIAVTMPPASAVVVRISPARPAATQEIQPRINTDGHGSEVFAPSVPIRVYPW